MNGFDKLKVASRGSEPIFRQRHGAFCIGEWKIGSDPGSGRLDLPPALEIGFDPGSGIS